VQPTTDPAASAVLAVVFLPFVAAGLVPLVYRLVGERTAYYAAAIALACFGLVASQYGTHGAVSFPWIRSLGVSLSFYVDGLSLLVGFLASGVGVLILTYSGGYMHGEPSQPKYYASLLAFMGSMLGVAFAADLIALFVFWELTSLSSFMLIGHYQRQESSQYAARKSMLITVAGGLFMLIGFLLLHAVTGEFSIVYMLENPELVQEELRSAGLFLPVLGLLGVGIPDLRELVPLGVRIDVLGLRLRGRLLAGHVLDQGVQFLGIGGLLFVRRGLLFGRGLLRSVVFGGRGLRRLARGRLALGRRVHFVGGRRVGGLLGRGRLRGR